MDKEQEKAVSLFTEDGIYVAGTVSDVGDREGKDYAIHSVFVNAGRSVQEVSDFTGRGDFAAIKVGQRVVLRVTLGAKGGFVRCGVVGVLSVGV